MTALLEFVGEIIWTGAWLERGIFGRAMLIVVLIAVGLSVYLLLGRG